MFDVEPETLIFSIPAFQHFSISAFQHFSISAFQFFSISVFQLFRMFPVRRGARPPRA
jgi:hypothetical protein